MMDFEINEKQQCVIDALLPQKNNEIARKTLNEITQDCYFVSVTQAASILGTLKRKGVTVKTGGLWRLTGEYLRHVDQKQYITSEFTMTPKEYNSLFGGDETVKDSERVLYMLIRAHMNSETFISGQGKGITYQYFIRKTRFTPKVGSKEPIREFSRGQIKRLLASMVERGWIQPLHDQQVVNERMVYLLPLAKAGTEL